MPTLFITSTHIGDGILSTGLYQRLVEDAPDDPITVACGGPAAKVFEAAPNLADILIIKKKRHAGHWRELWGKTARTRWTRIVDLRRSILPWILRADRRFSQPKPPGMEHRVVSIARTLGLPPQAPVLWTRLNDEAAAASLIGDDPRPILALAPGASWRGKLWPAERFSELAHRLTAGDGPLRGARLLMIGAPDERPMGQSVFDTFPEDRIIDGFGAPVLTTGAALRRCALMVGNDSAMMHLSAATGIPTVGLFGPTRDGHYAPYGPNGLVVRTPETREELIGHADYDRHTTPSLLQTLTVERVETAIRERYRR